MESVERLSGRVSQMREELAMFDSAPALESRRKMLEFKEALMGKTLGDEMKGEGTHSDGFPFPGMGGMDFYSDNQIGNDKKGMMGHHSDLQGYRSQGNVLKSQSGRQLPPPPPAESFGKGSTATTAIGGSGKLVQPLAIRRAPPDHMNNVLMSEPVFCSKSSKSNSQRPSSDDTDSVSEVLIGTNSPPRPVTRRNFNTTVTQISKDIARDLLTALRHSNTELLYTSLEVVDDERQWLEVQQEFQNIAPDYFYRGDLVAAMEKELTSRQLNVCKNILQSNEVVLRDSNSKLIALRPNNQNSSVFSRSSARRNTYDTHQPNSLRSQYEQPIKQPTGMTPSDFQRDRSVNQRGRTRSGYSERTLSVSPQREPSLRGRSKRREPSVSIGSLVTVSGLANRSDLNQSQGKVVDKHSGVVKVRFPNEEVLLREQNVIPISSQQHTQRDDADVLFELLKKGDNKGVVSFCEEISNKREWESLSRDFETKVGNDIYITLKTSLDTEVYRKVTDILKNNLGIISPQYLSPDARSGKPSGAPFQRGKFCTSCGHELTTPYCGLTGKKHEVPNGADFLGSETKVVLISSVDVGSSKVRLSKERVRDIDSFDACLSMAGVSGRAAVYNDPDTNDCRKALRWLSKKPQSGDSLILYFTGGVDKQTGGLLTRDGVLTEADFERVLSSPSGVTVTLIFDCCLNNLISLPYKLCSSRGGGVRVVPNDDGRTRLVPNPKADIILISFSPSSHTFRSGVITSPFCQLLNTNSTPTLEFLYQSLGDYFKANSSTRMLQPEISLSWNALPRQERLILSDVIVS
eukprot:TRINITY_DN16626_c0_g1_i1.p1 TRINITY_DN16626_c0_g1~~TRINITY_DN16626_c0_g1_i1.p1  ORF type:complete len:819 (+),score=150.35 TRINITY_DN16626_c0_g1_i1:49-2457(+)